MDKKEYAKELDALARDICKALRAGPSEKAIVLAALNDLTTGSARVPEMLESLMATGALMSDFIEACEDDLALVLGEHNEQAHANVMKALTSTFGRFGGETKAEALKASCLTQKPDAWHTQTLAIANEPYLSWVLNQAARFGMAKGSVPVRKLYAVSHSLEAFAECHFEA